MRQRSLPVLMARPKHNLMAACILTVQHLQAQLLRNCSGTLPSLVTQQRDQTSDVIGCMGHGTCTLQSVRITMSMLAGIINCRMLGSSKSGVPTYRA